MPWSVTSGQGQSGNTWSWLGAAFEGTKLPFGTVCAPGQRYHPAILAHAIGTLAEMYPERLWVALATGEALNEHVTDDPWPPKSVRRERLRECVDIMRALLRGESVTYSGHVRVRDARLYSRPAQVPKFYTAALTAETARWAGAWADGLITVGGDKKKVQPILDAFRDGGGAGKPIFLQVALSHGKTEQEAIEAAQSWKFAAAGDSEFKADVTLPEYFDAAAAYVPLEKLREAVRISASVDEHVELLGRDLEIEGVERVYLHHVGTTTRHQEAFLANLAPALLRFDR